MRWILPAEISMAMKIIHLQGLEVSIHVHRNLLTLTLMSAILKVRVSYKVLKSLCWCVCLCAESVFLLPTAQEITEF